MIFGAIDLFVLEKVEADVIDFQPTPMHKAICHFCIAGGVGMPDVFNGGDDMTLDNENEYADEQE